jgi:hypothetical protein
MIRSYFFGSVSVVALILPLASSLGACGAGNIPLGTQSSAENGGSCKAGGGTCLPVGDAPCQTEAPQSDQDCNPQLLPSGPFCCLSLADAGPAQDSGPTSGGNCKAAGGTCLPVGNAPCGSEAPTSDQDCNPQLLPSGPFCCLSPADAGAARDSGSGAAAGGNCKAAGGTCLPIGDDPCSVQAPSSDQDCNPQLLPSGPFCCLSSADAG